MCSRGKLYDRALLNRYCSFHLLYGLPEAVPYREVTMGSTGTPASHALIVGATGIQGWAVTNELLEGYPTANSFDKVTALANRPPSENLLWPKSDKLQIVSGINLLNEDGQEALEKQIKESIPAIDSVTHLFFFGRHTAARYDSRTR